MAAGSGRIQKAARYFPDHRPETQNQTALCALRFLLGPESQTRKAARAETGRAQFWLGTKPRSRRARRSRPISASGSVCKRSCGCLCEGPADSWLGCVERAGQYKRRKLCKFRAAQQARTCSGSLTEGVWVGARGRRVAAADERRLERGLVAARETRTDGAN